MKIARMFLIRESRYRMMNAVIIVNITPTCKGYFRGYTYAFPFQKDLLLASVWPGTECTYTLIWKKSLIICFESYQDIPYSHTGRVGNNVNTLTQYVRDRFEDKSMLFTHFYVAYGKKYKLGLYLQQAGNTLALTY